MRWKAGVRACVVNSGLGTPPDVLSLYRPRTPHAARGTSKWSPFLLLCFSCALYWEHAALRCREGAPPGGGIPNSNPEP